MPGSASRENGKKGGRPKGRINERTRAVRARLMRDHELTAEATVEQIRRLAFYDIRKFFDAKGNLLPLHKLSESDASAIAGFEVVKRNLTAGDDSTDVILKIKLADRAKYVEMAAKHHGLLTEKVEHSGGLTIRHELPDD